MKKWFLANNLANLVTTTGLVVTVLVLIVAATTPDRLWLILILAGLVGASDLLDGWLARRFKIESAIGGALDPLRDKLFICGTLVILAWYWPTVNIGGILEAFTKALIILIIGIETVLILVGIIGLINRIQLISSPYGRRKMFCQLIAVYLWLCSVTAERYCAITSITRFSIYLIDLMLLIAAHLGLRSLEDYYQRRYKRGA